VNVIAESESSPPESGMTVQLVGDPDFDGVTACVRLSPEDLGRVRAYVEQGHDVQAIELVDPELHGRIWGAVLDAMAPAAGWGVADDIQLRDLVAAPENGGGQ